MTNKLNIEYLQVESLVSPKWRATHTIRPNLLAVSSSLQMYGFIQPIHIMGDMKTIIDGSERVSLAKSVKRIAEKTDGLVPVVVHHVDEMQAMMMHLQLNRGNGNEVAKKVSNIIRKLYVSGKYTQKDFDSILCMKQAELELMLDGSIFKSRKISEHNYSRAWVPVEAPPGTIDSGPVIEKPPNADR